MTAASGQAVSPGAARSRESFMVATIAGLLAGAGPAGMEHVAVGANSPIPAAGALLARRRRPGLRVSLLGSERHNVFTDGNRELFDCAAQGRIDAFFLSGGQIDGCGRINLVGIGDYPDVRVRFPGSFGSAFLYPLVPRVILFREAHDRRSLVETVDFVSAAPGEGRPGERNRGPAALVTGRAVFRFDADRGRFALSALADGESAEAVRAATGFGFDVDEGAAACRPDPELDAEIDALVRDELAEDYPAFLKRRLAIGPG